MPKDMLDKFLDDKIIATNLEEIMADGFGRYSKYIIQERALPDVRDGLKPVQRRILYGMNQMGVFSGKPYKKCARITGEVMGKYHPHGDSSIYEALIRLSQDFKMLLPLVDVHGNNGSIDGDSPAAMRYTEARLAKAAEVLLEDLDKRTVSFIPNFDDQELEPVVLPSKFPNLLVNGASGIAAGYATKIPPHNLNEVINATITLLKNPNASVLRLMQYLHGPDFPTGGIVQGRDEIISAFTNGAGRVVVRGKLHVKETDDGPRIIITEIPYEVNKAQLVHSIDQLRVDKVLDDIVEIRDETDQSGLQIAIDLKKGSDPNIVIAYLYKNTELQVYFNYNIVSIIDHKPQQTGIIPILKAYINHQKEVITNRSNYLLERAEKRKHIVEGLIKMVSIIDEVIKIIRQSINKQNSKENLMSIFDFSELQAEAIVTLQLYRLSTTDINDLKEEMISLNRTIKELTLILSDEDVLNNVIETELRNVQGLLGVRRKTSIEDKIETIKIDEKELVSEEKIYLGITKEGYVTRSSLKNQKQSKNQGLKENDAYLFKGETTTLETALIFTDQGNYIFLPLYKLEEQKWSDLGTHIGNLAAIKSGEKPVGVIIVKNFDTNQDILLATKKAVMKQVKLRDLKVSRYSKPIKVISLNKGDELVSIDYDIRPNIVSVSKNGNILRFKTIELPQYGLQASGVKSMALDSDDELIGAAYISENDDIAVLTNRGHVIREAISTFKLYGRYRRGTKLIDQLKTAPHIMVSLQAISKQQDKDNVLVNIITKKTNVYLISKELKSLGNKYGKKVVKEEDGEPVRMIVNKSNNEEVYVNNAPRATTLNEKNVEVVEEVGIEKEIKAQVKKRTDSFLSTKSLADKIVNQDKPIIKLTKLDLFDNDED